MPTRPQQRGAGSVWGHPPSPQLLSPQQEETNPPTSQRPCSFFFFKNQREGEGERIPSRPHVDPDLGLDLMTLRIVTYTKIKSRTLTNASARRSSLANLNAFPDSFNSCPDSVNFLLWGSRERLISSAPSLEGPSQTELQDPAGKECWNPAGVYIQAQ